MSDSRFMRFASNGPNTIEAIIRAARNYVQPSDDLRPRVLEAARVQHADQLAERKLGTFALAVLAVVLISSPILRYATLIQSAAPARSSTEIENRAEALAAQPSIGSHWALAESISQWRHIRADKLGRNNRSQR